MTRKSLVALVFGMMLFAGPAFADVPPPEEEEGRETSFQAVSGSTEEQVPGGALMVGAYAAIWLFVGLYVMRMGLSQRAIESDIAGIEKRIARLERPEA